MGLFTAALVRDISKPGMDLSDIARDVRQVVSVATNGTQVPSGAAAPDLPKFYFTPPPPPPPPKASPPGLPRVGKDRIEYVLIPNGKFLMGCVQGSECNGEEKPPHSVEITKPFWMGRTEVTEDAFQRFLSETHRKFKKSKSLTNAGKSGSLPMVNISWEEAQAYCGWAGGRLPTEAEWEYAARGGKDNQIYPYSNVAESRDKANFIGKGGADIYEELAPVASFDPNAFNLFDMAGNAWEWVEDFYSPDYYEKSPREDPKGPSTGTNHVVRGGSFNSDPKRHLRISFRSGKVSDRSNEVGFRCMLPDTPEVKAQFRN
jgi:formylglycine-generating enzyme required for sulfatase activity